MSLENSTTPTTEVQEAVPPTPDSYTAVEEAIKSTKAEIAEEMAAGKMDEVIASANKVKELEAQKDALLAQAQEGAMAEDAERTTVVNAEKMKDQAQEEAIEEDKKRTALVEIQKRQAEDKAKADAILAEIQGGTLVEVASSVEQAQEKASPEDTEKFNELKSGMTSLYRRGGTEGQAFNNFSGQTSKEADDFKVKLKELSESEQQKLGEDFFNDTIGKNISNNANAYKIYMAMGGTAFSKKFAEMEDARLKRAGYGGFRL